jgi:hypothetical protein
VEPLKKAANQAAFLQRRRISWQCVWQFSPFVCNCTAGTWNKKVSLITGKTKKPKEGERKCLKKYRLTRIIHEFFYS